MSKKQTVGAKIADSLKRFASDLRAGKPIRVTRLTLTKETLTMKKIILALAVVLAIPAVSSACPPVAIQSFGVQAYAAPVCQQVQAFAAPVYSRAFVQAVSYPVAVQAVVQQNVVVRQRVRVRRTPIRNFLSRPARVSVQVGNLCY